MKAVTCPQCGALVKEILLKEKFAVCDYCGAKIILSENRDRIVEISDQKSEDKKQLTPWEQHRENYRKVNERAARYNEPHHYLQNNWPFDAPSSDSEASIFWRIFCLIGVLVAIGIVFFNSKSCLVRPLDKPEKKTLAMPESPKTPFPTLTPAPSINYEVKLQWNGPNDIEHYELPEIDMAKLPTTNTAELRKTVFKNRAVQVRVTIDTEGEVTSAEGVSGHPILKESAVQAARRTRFNQRQKPTTRLLTYYFHLKDE